jgi:uncharacterized protein YrrD
MTMRIDELKDKPVMSIASGTKLGSVHDALLDDSYLQIAALVIGGGGLFGGHKQAVAYGAIHGIGPDAVMVSGEDAVQEIGDASPLRTAHAFDAIQQQVMSESGVNLGHVVEMEFEPQTGALTSLCFAAQDDTTSGEGEVCDLAREDIVSMTEKLVIVRHSVVQQTDPERPSSPAHDRGQVMNQEPEDAADLAANAGESGAAGL